MTKKSSLTTLWKPNPGKQTEVLTREEFEILYGGQRAAGKTDAGIGWLLYDKEEPRYRALCIRRNADDLVDWCDRAKVIYESLGAKTTGKPSQFVFPRGSKVRTGHLKDENAYMKYQGHEYQKMLIEELTQIPTERNYEMLISSCRSTIPGIKPQVFATCNPDGPGFYWVKKRWNLKGIPKDIILTEVVDLETKKHLDRVFVPAGLSDNPYLNKDHQYRAFLNSLPDGLREAWRDGSWDDPIIEGAYYTKELLQMKKENRIKFIAHDPRLKVHTVWDLGIDDSMTIGFWQRTAKDITLIDYYENEGFGLQHYWDIIEERRVKKHFKYGKYFLPHDAKKRELKTGETVEKAFNDLGMRPTDVIPRSDIQMGIHQVRLMFPQLYINDPDCSQFLSAARNYCKKWNEKLLKYDNNAIHNWASHAADMLRGTAMIYEQMTNEDVQSKVVQSEGIFRMKGDRY